VKSVGWELGNQVFSSTHGVLYVEKDSSFFVVVVANRNRNAQNCRSLE